MFFLGGGGFERLIQNGGNIGRFSFSFDVSHMLLEAPWPAVTNPYIPVVGDFFIKNVMTCQSQFLWPVYFIKSCLTILWPAVTNLQYFLPWSFRLFQYCLQVHTIDATQLIFPQFLLCVCVVRSYISWPWGTDFWQIDVTRERWWNRDISILPLWCLVPPPSPARDRHIKLINFHPSATRVFP